MCCILCEEPIRTITFGIAAVGIVAIVKGARKLLTNHAESREPQRSPDHASAVGDVAL